MHISYKKLWKLLIDRDMRKKEAYREYRKAKQEMTDFVTAKYDIERFLNLEKEEETRAREKTKTEEETL